MNEPMLVLINSSGCCGVIVFHLDINWFAPGNMSPVVCPWPVLSKWPIWPCPVHFGAICRRVWCLYHRVFRQRYPRSFHRRDCRGSNRLWFPWHNANPVLLSVGRRCSCSGNCVYFVWFLHGFCSWVSPFSSQLPLTVVFIVPALLATRGIFWTAIGPLRMAVVVTINF